MALSGERISDCLNEYTFPEFSSGSFSICCQSPGTLSPAARCYACRHFSVLGLSWISRQLFFNFLKSFLLEDKSDLLHVLFLHTLLKSDSILKWEVHSIDERIPWCECPAHHHGLRQVFVSYRALWKQELDCIIKALDAFNLTVGNKRSEKAFCTTVEIKMLAAAYWRYTTPDTALHSSEPVGLSRFSWSFTLLVEREEAC